MKSRYYDDKKSSVLKLADNNDWEMTLPKYKDWKPVIKGRPLFSLRNNVPESSDR